MIEMKVQLLLQDQSWTGLKTFLNFSTTVALSLLIKPFLKILFNFFKFLLCTYDWNDELRIIILYESQSLIVGSEIIVAICLTADNW